ncbi:hypothetical protein HG531_007914 [Fusarium graminearum]|nr:hypothetical protein HG531_007914 [Fusarium graminearum]
MCSFVDVPPLNTQNPAPAEEPQETEETNKREHGSSVQKELEKTYTPSKVIKVGAGNANNEKNVSKQPADDETSSERLVTILDIGLLDLLLFLERSKSTADCLLKLTVNILLLLLDFLDDNLVLLSLGDVGRGKCLGLVGTLGTPRNIVPVVERVDHENVDVEVLEQSVDDGSTCVTEWPSVNSRGSIRFTHKIHNDGCYELNVKEEHADDVMTRLVHSTEVHQRVQSGSERTVEPTTTLTDEFSGTFGNIGFTLGSLDIRQMPLLASLGDQLETQNTILSQEHRLVENVGDLVLEVLDSNEGVEQLLAALTQHGVNFTTSTTKILVVVETLPKSKERSGTGLGTRIKQNTHLRVQDTTEGVEQPSMRVDLLGVLLLQTEDHLNWWQVLGTLVCRSDELLVGGDGKLGGVFEDVGNGLLAVDILLDDTILVNTYGGKYIKGVLVSLINTVENQADNDLLPSRATLVPESRLLQVDDIADVLHSVMQGSGKQNLVFVIVCNGNKQLSVSVVHARPQIVTVLEGEVVGITCGSGVSHLVEFLSATLGITVLRLNSVLDGTGNGVINAQD